MVIMKKISSLLFASMILVGSAFAQTKGKVTPTKKPTTQAPAPQTVAQADTTVKKPKKRKPIQDGFIFTDSLLSDSATQYPKVEMKDVILTRRIWRDIDFRDPGNKVLNSQVVNVAAEIYKAIAAGELDMYDNNDENFKKDPINNEEDPELTKKYGGRKTSLAEETFIGTTTKEDKNGNIGPALNIDKVEGNELFFTENFYKIRLKEDWILDGKRGVFEPHIIGVALLRKPEGQQPVPNGQPPVADPNNTTGTQGTPVNGTGYSVGATDLSNEPGEVDGQIIGWIPFEQLRQVLARVKIPNENNDFSGITYDDIFMKRLFFSNIIKASTASEMKLKDTKFNGRLLTRKELLLESERIKKEMGDFEQGLWEY